MKILPIGHCVPVIPRTSTPNLHSADRWRYVVDSEGVARVVVEREALEQAVGVVEVEP